MTGVRSCRKLEAACRDQIPYLWLTGWQHPDHNTLWRFYKGHRQVMRKLFERTVRSAVTMKLVDLAVQAVDAKGGRQRLLMASISVLPNWPARMSHYGECDMTQKEQARLVLNSFWRST